MDTGKEKEEGTTFVEALRRFEEAVKEGREMKRAEAETEFLLVGAAAE